MQPINTSLGLSNDPPDASNFGDRHAEAPLHSVGEEVLWAAWLEEVTASAGKNLITLKALGVTMKLTPVEILNHLGFTVPVDGIDISPHDALLHVSTLKALGATMNVMAVPNDTLEGMHNAMAGLVSAYRGTEVKPRVDGESFLQLQGTMAALLKVYYQRRSPELDQALAAADESAKPPGPSQSKIQE